MSETKRFAVLDSLRGIAACLVVLFHLLYFTHSHLAAVTFIQHGYLFVDFFFVLSGFVIAANYERRLIEGFGIWRFTLLRFGRVYPLHVSMLGVCILIHLAHAHSGLGTQMAFQPPDHSADTVIANLLLVHSLNIFDFLTWNSPSWSISSEFYTYILYALALALTKDRIGYLLLPVALLSAVALGILVDDMDTSYNYALLRCVFGFSAGALAWKVHRASLLRSGTALELLSVALIGSFVWGAGRTELSIAAPVVFAPAVLVFAAEAGAVSRVLRRPVFLLLGAWSYSIYMVHFVLGGALVEAARLLRIAGVDILSGTKLGRDLWQGDVACLVFFALVLCAAALTYRLIEVPGRTWFRSLAGTASSSQDRRLELRIVREPALSGTAAAEDLPVPAVVTSADGAPQLHDDVARWKP